MDFDGSGSLLTSPPFASSPARSCDRLAATLPTAWAECGCSHFSTSRWTWHDCHRPIKRDTLVESVLESHLRQGCSGRKSEFEDEGKSR
jgi:hypothetical protein